MKAWRSYLAIVLVFAAYSIQLLFSGQVVAVRIMVGLICCLLGLIAVSLGQDDGARRGKCQHKDKESTHDHDTN